jgi:arginase
MKLIGIPSFSGGLYSGTELAPEALRRAGLAELLKEKGIDVEDMGDIIIPSYIPRHNIPPIRNWPGPRIVWDEISKETQSRFQSGDFTLLLGGDCSIVTGTVNGLTKCFGDKVYLIYLDAHVDTVKPASEICVGAAAMGLWFLCDENMFYPKPEEFDGTHIHLLGCQMVNSETYGINLHSLEKIRKDGLEKTASKVLSSLPEDAKILIHLDLDIIKKDELHAVYAPSEEGMYFDEIRTLLSSLLSDSRIIGMEVTEFSGIHDRDGSQAAKLAQLLAEVLG